MESKTFTGHSSALKAATPWLASEDLIGRGDVPAVIEQVLVYDEVAFVGGRKEKNVPALKFKDRTKQLVLRTGANRKTLVKLFGADTQKWIGQTIHLYHEPDVMMKGERVGGIRIRAN
jgi:hypothetical protein